MWQAWYGSHAGIESSKQCSKSNQRSQRKGNQCPFLFLKLKFLPTLKHLNYSEPLLTHYWRNSEHARCLLTNDKTLSLVSLSWEILHCHTNFHILSTYFQRTQKDKVRQGVWQTADCLRVCMCVMRLRVSSLLLCGAVLPSGGSIWVTQCEPVWFPSHTVLLIIRKRCCTNVVYKNCDTCFG